MEDIEAIIRTRHAAMAGCAIAQVPGSKAPKLA
jgi:hypothetical protein